MQVVVNNLLVNYTKVGKGPVVLGLHGWGDSLTTFNQLAKDLQSNYQFIALDLPGFGTSQIPAEAWGVGEYANFVGRWLKKLGIGKAKAIIGHSNGGAIAIYGISENLIQAEKLILLASAGVRDQKKGRKKLLRIVVGGGKAATAILPHKAKKKIKSKFYKSIGSEALLLPELEESFRRIVGEDVQGRAKKLSIPTLLIYGAKDKAVPLSYGQLLHDAIPHSKLEVLPNAEHFVHLEEAQKVSALVQQFLTRKKYDYKTNS
jgi:pimeloyl-ACP methyl ester carboxylesterase